MEGRGDIGEGVEVVVCVDGVGGEVVVWGTGFCLWVRSTVGGWLGGGHVELGGMSMEDRESEAGGGAHRECLLLAGDSPDCDI